MFLCLYAPAHGAIPRLLAFEEGVFFPIHSIVTKEDRRYEKAERVQGRGRHGKTSQRPRLPTRLFAFGAFIKYFSRHGLTNFE